ncbi:CBS domain-containing protein [Tepidibacillus infernus]|uniref:Inosine-5'-monophosphate dehydrogenase n=1 Tax=Tepidibacillus decaturensis TaxID=1413211 RepID=A0A135L4S3_9BACI|nr:MULTISPECIES: CBS domain-containing protein [Tepidibacillus]KXG43929.1 inosine-5'-monophosphate dehydrogenase [Tepidibacillus decaturensis]GBF12382.1 hypoxic response protein 1 [Tepidibacillus sp. HK-1]
MTTLRDIMTTNVATVSLQDNAYEVAQKMSQLNVGAIPVVDGQNVIGMITDRDLVLRGYAEKRSGSFAIDGLMSKDVVVGTPDMDVHEAARLMAEKQIRRLPVVENGNLVGIVSLGDLAVRNIHIDEAGQALSKISEPAQPGTHGTL